MLSLLLMAEIIFRDEDAFHGVASFSAAFGWVQNTLLLRRLQGCGEHIKIMGGVPNERALVL
jgi:hypothetical protein